MDRGALLLQDLRVKLQRTHLDRLRRTLHADVTIEPGERGEFTVVVQPKRPAGATPFKKLFSRQLVFAGTYHLSPHAWAVEKRACDYATDIVREALQQRGML
jgi:hypothetical protein